MFVWSYFLHTEAKEWSPVGGGDDGPPGFPFPPTPYSFQPTPSYGSWLKEFVVSEGYDYQLSCEQNG